MVVRILTGLIGVLLFGITVFVRPALADGPLCPNPVPLELYPRPANDNGWGIHWGPGGEAQEPAAIAYFVGELESMNIRWVKIINRETRHKMDPVVDSLVGAGMMPVMRVTVDGMAPLHPPEVEAMVRHYRGRGVPYFELYNEPNLLVEWPAGAAIDIGWTADVWIPAAAAVQRAGGFPSIPALAPGGHWEDMDFLRRFLLEVRRRAENGDSLAMDVLCGVPGKPGLWIAVHNYGLNHYFDYPRDPINLNASMVTEAEKAYYGIEPELVNGLNEIRLLDARPFYVGDRVIDDSNGFFKFLATAEIFKETIGYIPPAIITEGGWLPNERQDERYPPVTPEFQANETLRGYKYMQAEAPNWLLAWQPWILCNAACNGSDMRFESHAWYKGRRESDALSIVPTLKVYAASPSGKAVRNSGANPGLPWWVGQSDPALIPRPGEGLLRVPFDLIMDAAQRLGKMNFLMYENSDSVLTMPDPLAMSNRYILKNTTSRQVGVNIPGLIDGLNLSPYGSAVVEIQPQEVLTATEPVTTTEEMVSRVSVVRLPGEGETEFVSRQVGPTILPVASGTTLTSLSSTSLPGYVDMDNPHRFGVQTYRRLSCQENPFLAILYVTVLDTAGQPIDGINLLFNTPDGQNPVTATSGDKGPGQAEFTLIGYAEPGQRREWTVEVPESAGGSPQVTGIRTDLPDDPCPEGTNRTGHYSYRVIFQEDVSRGIPPKRTPLEVVPPSWTYPLPRPSGNDSTALDPLPLTQWPRPKGDNGRGLHYNPTGYFGEDNDYMLELLVKYHMSEEMDMRWITVYYKDENQLRRIAAFIRDTGMMGVFRPALLPTDDYAAWRVKQDIDILHEYGLPPYIQIYNEPTVGQEWSKGGYTDDDKLEIYRRNFIAAADRVYEAGGYVGFQDVDVDSLRALLGSIKAQQKLYLFNHAFFVPHCYGSNHPPAYPYDPQNQADRPGTTIYDDYQVSVLCFQKFAQVWQEEVGFVPPMIMGEGGWATSIMEDPRYPRVTMQNHADWHVEMFDWFRTGILSNGDPLPDYLFAVTPWLVHADHQMQFDENAWFYSRLTGTKHETVEGVRAMPYFERRFSWEK